VGRKTIKQGPGKRHIDGKDFHLADEIRYIQRRAAEHDGRFVRVGSLALFSTDTGDAWLLDPEDHLAARLARDGDPEDVYFEETDARFAIGWKGEYRIDGRAFVYIDHESSRVVTILGYPVRRIAEWGDREISNMLSRKFGLLMVLGLLAWCFYCGDWVTKFTQSPHVVANECLSTFFLKVSWSGLLIADASSKHVIGNNQQRVSHRNDRALAAPIWL
jgi:hypothetical protein